MSELVGRVLQHVHHVIVAVDDPAEHALRVAPEDGSGHVTVDPVHVVVARERRRVVSRAAAEVVTWHETDAVADERVEEADGQKLTHRLKQRRLASAIAARQVGTGENPVHDAEVVRLRNSVQHLATWDVQVRNVTWGTG